MRNTAESCGPFLRNTLRITNLLMSRFSQRSGLKITNLFPMSVFDYEKGMATRRKVLGDAHVDRAEARKTDFDADFQDYIVHSAWSAVWSRPGLTPRERSLITIALLTALGHHEELAMHLRATANTGATPEDVKEVLLHTGVYAGVPATNQAMKLAKEVLGQGEGEEGNKVNRGNKGE